MTLCGFTSRYVFDVLVDVQQQQQQQQHSDFLKPHCEVVKQPAEMPNRSARKMHKLLLITNLYCN